jgi:COP9 signalosome complex subunit 6
MNVSDHLTRAKYMTPKD